MAKTKDSIERKKPEKPRTSRVALHQIRKPLQRTLPWLTTNKTGPSNNSSSQSQTTIDISENDEIEMLDDGDDIYGSQFTDGIY